MQAPRLWCLLGLQVEMVDAEACCLETPSEPQESQAPRGGCLQVLPNSLPQGSLRACGLGPVVGE